MSPSFPRDYELHSRLDQKRKARHETDLVDIREAGGYYGDSEALDHALYLARASRYHHPMPNGSLS